MKIPETLKRLDEIAITHGWNTDLIELEEDETFARVYTAPGPFVFTFVIGFGLNPHTNRWVMLETEDGNAFMGVLFEDDYPIIEWGWKRRTDLRYWLSHPDELFTRGVTIPPRIERRIAALMKSQEEEE